jgi:arginase
VIGWRYQQNEEAGDGKETVVVQQAVVQQAPVQQAPVQQAPGERARDEWAFIGVPSSAGAHHAGQDLAPDALRAAGLLRRLAAAGVAVTDTGDIAGSVFAADYGHPRARNLDAVVRVAREVADAVAAQLAAGRRVLVAGGDCTITLGVIAGFRRRHPDVGLAYVDGDADLGALDTTGSGILDASGVAHLLGRGEAALIGLAGEGPLLAPSRLALIGCDPREVSDAGRRFLADAGVSYCGAADLQAEPEAAAARALAALDSAAGPLVVHFDVDVVDSADLPLGNFPHYGSGTLLDQAAACVRPLVQHPACAGLVLTEVNPTYDPAGGQLARYIGALVETLSG